MSQRAEGMTMLLTNLLNKRRARRTLIGHPGRQLSENLGQTAAFSGGWWAAVRGANQERKMKEKCHFKSAENKVRKHNRFLCLLLYVWTIKDIQIQGC